MGQDNLWQDIEVISRGANRICVVDPCDASYCIKLDLEQTQAKTGWSNKLRRFIAQALPTNSFAHQEYRHFRQLEKEVGPSLHQHFALVDGLVETPMGLGIRCQRILNADGSAAQPIHYFFDHAAEPDLEALIAALDQFGDFLLEQDIPLFDLNSGNLLVKKSATGIQLICVDIKSLGKTKELIPFTMWFKSLRQRKLQRRLGRLRKMIFERKLPLL